MNSTEASKLPPSPEPPPVGPLGPVGRELRSTERKLWAAFAFALACLAGIGVLSHLSVARLNENIAWVEHTHEVLDRVGSLAAAVTDSESAARGYVITGDESYLESYQQSAQIVTTGATQLRRLTVDNSLQQPRLVRLAALVTERLATLRQVINLRREKGFAMAHDDIITGKGKGFHDQFRLLVGQVKATETSLLRARERSAESSERRAQQVILGGGILAGAIVILALFAVRRDFAGRTRAEQALRQVNEHLELRVRARTVELARLASIVEFSDDAIASKDLNGIITSWNPGAERLFGYSAQEAMGKPMAMLIPPERSSEEPTILGRIAQGEATDHFETVRIRKDGQAIDISVSISPLRDSQGRIVGASKIARDITDRKRADEKVQAQLARLGLLQQITRAIGERQDVQSIFQAVVRTLEEHLPLDFCCIGLYEPTSSRITVTSVGLHSTALAMELALTEQAHIPIDANGLSQCVRGRLAYEPDIREVPFPFPQRLAKGGLAALVAAPLLVESKVFGVMIAARRRAGSFTSGECEFLRQASEHVALATHQAQLYSALQEAYDDLRQTQTAVLQQERLLALGQMASGIAHDINNAISPVALYTESLLERESGLTATGRRHLETIQRAIEDVAQTVARMREFYRPREAQLALQPVDLNRLVEQVAELTRARWSDMAQRRGIVIEMRIELAPNLPTIMAADNEIREALTNLIFNAVDAMPDGGPLTLRTSLGQQEGFYATQPEVRHFVRVEVIDAGVGMDEDTRRRCLEPFFTTKGERGTGLGLAMVYGMIQRHSADIEIDSAVGKGTTMRLSFPISNVPTVNNAPASEPRVVPPMRILVVDDDPLVLRSLRDSLEGDGHAVTAMDGGQAGIEAFLSARAREDPFPVVITDLGMPYVDGRRVASAVKAAAPATTVLMLTGWGQRLAADGDIPADVDCVLGKPVRLRELREALARCSDVRARK